MLGHPEEEEEVEQQTREMRFFEIRSTFEFLTFRLSYCT